MKGFGKGFGGDIRNECSSVGQLRGGAVFADSVVRVSCGAGITGSEPRIEEAAGAQLLPGRGVAVWYVSVRQPVAWWIRYLLCW